ncbi:MAG: sugar phosphate isomerase/epimerase [Lachnospiraceae bacterium]|nr:sugar phosphate isomerase/epimerase [Lachnospiraceae bacterium]
MKLAISNIAWAKEYDEQMYAYLQKTGFSGVEIAPTRIFAMPPYEKIEAARLWAQDLKERYDLSVPSLQSIWYQRSENLFQSEAERRTLLDYTKKAIDFAQATESKNLVFGCPRNRNRNIDCPMSETECMEVARNFFRELGEYAKLHNTVLALEPNPPVYNTNLMNDTASAFAMAKQVESEGCKVNVDLGTILTNEESLDIVRDHIALVNHIHISEPGMNCIEKRELHAELAHMLKQAGYTNYISIEMKNLEDIVAVQEVCAYVAEVFG